MLIEYLIIVNLLSSFLFILDKHNSKKNKKRVSENSLHFLELIGGVFGIVILMNVIRHKNRKWKYFIISYLILVIWVRSIKYF